MEMRLARKWQGSQRCQAQSKGVLNTEETGQMPRTAETSHRMQTDRVSPELAVSQKRCQQRRRCQFQQSVEKWPQRRPAVLLRDPEGKLRDKKQSLEEGGAELVEMLKGRKSTEHYLEAKS